MEVTIPRNQWFVGVDVELVLAYLVREYMQEKHDACNGNYAAIMAFLEEHDSLVRQCYRRIVRYESFCTEYRSRVHFFGEYSPFCWFSETCDRVRAVLRAGPRKRLVPYTVEEREHHSHVALAKYRESLPWPDFPNCSLKDGIEHPLEVNQVRRSD